MNMRKLTAPLSINVTAHTFLTYLYHAVLLFLRLNTCSITAVLVLNSLTYQFLPTNRLIVGRLSRSFLSSLVCVAVECIFKMLKCQSVEESSNFSSSFAPAVT